MSYPRALLSLALAFACTAAQADPGDLDVRFSGDGVALIDAGGLDEAVYALAPDADNAVFAAGALYEVTNPFAPTGKGGATGYEMTIVRLLADGGLDPAWGEGGYAQVGFGGDSEHVRDMVRLADGSLVVAGSLERESHSDFGVARFTAQGFVDELFGEFPAFKGVAPRLGAVAFNVGPDDSVNDEAIALAVQSDDSIVVAGIGYANDGAFKYPRFGIARLTPDGQLDDTFPGDGWFTVAPLAAEASEYVTAIARRRDGTLTPDDGFVVAGYSNAGNRAILRRFLADGTPDPQFGTQGLVTVQAGPGTGMFRIDDAVIDSLGRIVVVGRGNDRGYAFMRFMPDGDVDASFGTSGRRHVKFSGESDYDLPNALMLQADGKIVAAGEATSRATGAPRSDFASVRLLPDGAIDTGFGDGAGRSTYPVSVEGDTAWAVTVTSDGSLLLAGQADVGTPDNDMALLRLQGDPTIFADGFED